jgi:ketosteroid isomerase-like protein
MSAPSDHPHQVLVNAFYAAFQRRDREAMIACYHPDVVFSDPVFPHLEGSAVGAMWRMLGSGGVKPLGFSYRDVRADDELGCAHWEATYIFPATGRRVHNVIEARFRFRDGKIVRHEDTFDLWRWAGMALGVPGRLLGWAPPMQRAIRKKAADNLAAFLAKPAAGGGG